MKKNSKSGITFSVVVVSIVIMLIVISTATVVGSNSISNANFERYQSEIGWVISDVNAYYVANGSLPVTNEAVSYDTLTDGLKATLTENGDNNSNLLVVDMVLLDDPNIKNGNGSVSSKDVFVVSDKTHNIYYLAGFKYRGTVYYNL